MYIFVRLYLNCSISLFPFLPPRFSTAPLPTLLQIHGLFFHLCTPCIYAYVYAYIFLNITCLAHVSLPCVYVFSAKHLALNNQWCALPCRGPSLSRPTFLLPIVLCVGLRPYGLFPIHFGMPIGVILVQLTFGQSC